VSGPKRVYTIPSGAAFVDALAAGLNEMADGDPLKLAAITVLLPTRRACRSLREAFLRLSTGAASLLPRLMPLGDIDSDELELADEGGDSGFDLPPVLPGLRRQLMLTRLVATARDIPWDQAAALARELARLLDQVETERADFARLADLVPDDYAEHWKITLDFLKLLTELWPGVVEGSGAVEPARRRNLLLEAQAKRWAEHPPSDPVIAAGSTGSIPATADLLATIASLPNGAVVLPGLDQAMPDKSWDAIEACHPQFGLKLLLDKLGVTRGEVGLWRGVSAEAQSARARLLSLALDPLADRQTLGAGLAAGLEGVARLDCLGPQQEAGAIALLMREVLETPERTAALVTPDRGLARRVAAELRRFQIEIDDSAGLPLSTTPPGAFLRLIPAAIEARFAPAPLLALLKHPLSSGGMERGRFRALARLLERKVLRGPRPGTGFAGILSTLGERDEKALSAGERAQLERWIADLEQLFEPFAAALASEEATLSELAAAHARVAEALAATDLEPGAYKLWAGEAGEQAASFIEELIEAEGAGRVAIGGGHYARLFDELMIGRVVRPVHGRHPRLAIWGPLEARLQRADRMILGGLNEGVWPADPPNDPWLGRPMRTKFGLASPERRIGLAAHDFQQGFAAPEIFLTRADRMEGAPTVPSRWLRHVEAVTKLLRPENHAEQSSWLAWQAALDRPTAYVAIQPPAPRPPVEARPRSLAVTRIEQWMRDPYGLYARHILRLKKLDPLDADPGAAERGQFIHEALDRFVQAYPDHLPPDAAARLIEIGRAVFGPALGQPGVWAFWWPRFETIARWFAAEERRRRVDLAGIATELGGRIEIQGPAGAFEVAAKADRVERRQGGGIVLIDYKTGGLPQAGEIAAGLAPQLPLEGLIATSGGFTGIPADTVAALEFWRLSGGDPPGEVKAAKADLDAARAGLEELVRVFDDPHTPYLAVPRPDAAPRYNDYAHLARLKEWARLEERE
jgi:ATP-dependent helicase/nuclease subunit B